jgi:hypothetical protein
MMKIPKKIPFMFGEQLPNGVYVTRIIEVDKSSPNWKNALEEFIRREENEVLTDRKIKKGKR